MDKIQFIKHTVANWYNGAAKGATKPLQYYNCLLEVNKFMWFFILLQMWGMEPFCKGGKQQDLPNRQNYLECTQAVSGSLGKQKLGEVDRHQCDQMLD